MLEALKRLFIAPAGGPEEGPERDRDLRIATAALFFEVVRADGKVEDVERQAMRTAIQSTFDLAPEEIADLMRAAEERSREAVSLYELTEIVDRSLGPEDKLRIVELLWLLVFADGRKDPLEEHLVRSVAGLLHVSHPDFIDAKIRARSRIIPRE